MVATLLVLHTLLKKFTVINRFTLSDIMLIYQPIEILISVLYHCNTLTINQSSLQASLP